MRDDLFSTRILMCPPTHYSIDYSINPWMDPSRAVNWKLARHEWESLHHLIIRLGGYVELIDPQPGWPDMVFTANAGFFYVDTMYLSKFKHKERKGEEAYFKFWFEQNGFKVKTMGHRFEGAGDMLCCGEDIFFGSGFRSEIYARRELEAFHGVKSQVLKLRDPHFYHLDTCFCPVADNHVYKAVCMAYPPAFLNWKEIREGVLKDYDVIEVNEVEAKKFACNAVVIGDKIIIPLECDETAEKLENAGMEVFQTPMNEFIKSGGACKCLTLKLGMNAVS